LYLPDEDSLLLIKALNSTNLKDKIVLDLGCGSCFLTEKIKNEAKVVVSSDLDLEVLLTNRKLNNKNVFFVNTNLLTPFKRIFDFIFFNPPYLNFDEREGYYLDTTGGIRGYEITLKFLDQLINSLKIGGKAFLIASNYTINKIKEKINREKIFEYKILEKKPLIFETIYLMEISYSKIFNDYKDFFNLNPCYRFKFFSKGKNSIILEDNSGWLLKINKREKNLREFHYLSLIKEKVKFYHLFIPEFFLKENILFTKRIKGIDLKEINKKIEELRKLRNKNNPSLENKLKRLISLKYKILMKSLYISFILDKLKINKKEMNHPERHIIYSKGKVFFVDFEKAYLSKKRKNVTQLSFYIMKEMKRDFRVEERSFEKLKDLLKKYKKTYSLDSFKKIVEYFNKTHHDFLNIFNLVKN